MVERRDGPSWLCDDDDNDLVVVVVAVAVALVDCSNNGSDELP